MAFSDEHSNQGISIWSYEWFEFCQSCLSRKNDTEKYVTLPRARELSNVANDFEFHNMPSTSRASNRIDETSTTKTYNSWNFKAVPNNLPKNTTRKAKRTSKLRIYTDTPEKQRTEELQRANDEANLKREQKKTYKRTENCSKFTRHSC